MSAAGVVEHARKRAERKAEGLRVLEELLKEAQLHMTQDEESALWSLFSSGLDW